VLSKKKATELGKRGGRARTRNLSAEKRKEIASWAWLIREQRRRGEPTLAERREVLVERVRAVDPDLANFLDSLSKLDGGRAEKQYAALSDQDRRLIERLAREVLEGEDHV
jgi:hypothetical protein